MKAIKLVLKDIEWPDQLSIYEKNRELQVSLPLKKGPRTLHSVKYKSLQKRRWKLIHYF